MKYFIAFIFLFTVSSFAIDDASVTNTFQDSTIIEADYFNTNFDDVTEYLNELIDTLDERFMRFQDLLDSTLQKITVDSIRGNPDVDSLSGNPVIDSTSIGRAVISAGLITAQKATLDSIRGDPDIDSIAGEIITAQKLTLDTIRGNPDIDSLSGNPIIDSAQIGIVDINGGAIDGVVIGANSEDDATFDSLYSRTIKSIDADLDSIDIGTAGWIKCDTGSFPCTLKVSGGSASGDTIGTGRYFKLGNFVSVILSGIDASFSSVNYVRVYNYPIALIPNWGTGYGLRTPVGALGADTLISALVGYTGVECAITGTVGETQTFSLFNPAFSYYSVLEP